MLSLSVPFVTRKYKHLFCAKIGSNRKYLLHVENVVLLKIPNCSQLLLGVLFDVLVYVNHWNFSKYYWINLQQTWYFTLLLNSIKDRVIYPVLVHVIKIFLFPMPYLHFSCLFSVCFRQSISRRHQCTE